ncbi:hypothetical protein [Thalassococcus sp. S3]|uniref:hypothetical protein n=1 Tax=Thalassococcus sp. S3 TaxID=2017482 RepID=UPI00102460A7|nr:hypothetical protein [Thalassococcus sp. S3]QBF31519.1 hypothetical protein CFI11_09860 [Thalassococcus sp. S3]
MKPSRFRITDHAVIRYLERVEGMDLDAVRAKISAAVALAEDHPAACGVVSDGFTYKLKGDAVTTVMPLNSPDLRTGKQRRERPE